MEDESGKTVLSKEKADILRRWIELRKIHDTGEIITGKIVKRIKGGMVVDLKGVQAFLPGSQIDVRPVKDFDKYLDVEMELKVVKFNEMRKNVVVSHKAILEESLAEKRDEIFSTLSIIRRLFTLSGALFFSIYSDLFSQRNLFTNTATCLFFFNQAKSLIQKIPS